MSQNQRTSPAGTVELSGAEALQNKRHSLNSDNNMSLAQSQDADGNAGKAKPDAEAEGRDGFVEQKFVSTMKTRKVRNSEAILEFR